jgi:hypothetical protein
MGLASTDHYHPGSGEGAIPLIALRNPAANPNIPRYGLREEFLGSSLTEANPTEVMEHRDLHGMMPPITLSSHPETKSHLRERSQKIHA